MPFSYFFYSSNVKPTVCIKVLSYNLVEITFQNNLPKYDINQASNMQVDILSSSGLKSP